MENPVFKCDHCGREFEISYQLELHNKHLHGSPAPIKCSKCGQEFALQTQLDMHLAKYTHDSKDKPTNDYRGNRSAEQARKLY